MTAGFAFIAFGTRAVIRRLGARWHMSQSGDIATLPLFWGLFHLWGFASLPMSNAVSREFEHQADLYGLNASQAPPGLAEFMIHDADTVRLRSTSIEYALFYTHPSDAERVATAMQWRAASARLPKPPCRIDATQWAGAGGRSHSAIFVSACDFGWPLSDRF